ncbi:hypothetical protein [Flavobacterium collinsii]|jgi:hypothetical protein|uniref:Proteinase inhibitor I42 chagasin domain-containing protein n=1 Tax=Flavobacterium collinsii TaxID=1114861 RepID=A0A9W4TLE5_9FLAO|nr:hypothetical protein [Flavobacterium collinsii]GIQ57250.1 hypothetical protein Flavo103_03860 [Flavobacterium collinsii]CAI2769080.1 conserved exported protein of unknown function [Flavobacterium collinsii]
MKQFFFYCMLLFSFSASFAQSKPTFSVVGTAVNKESVLKNKRLDISKIKVENISNKPIYLVWETVSNTFPKEWDCSMCQHGACQIGIPKGSAFNKLNPDQQGFIAIHVIPANKIGNGTVKFKIYDKANPNYAQILTFEVEVL